ncbi:MAG: SIR2 family protein [Chloroflexi bacterium]|nr:SIR2 family protein [Chloroflexota bacterium]
MLDELITDDDIVEGHEDLHPKWLEAFSANRDYVEHLQRYRSRQYPGNIVDVFDNLKPVDPLIRQIDPMQEKIAFLLGAGASKPHPSNIPTVTELLPELLSRARRLEREPMTRLAKFCEDQRIDNIEDLLTAVQISEFCSRNPGVLNLVRFQLFRRVDAERERRSSGLERARTDTSSVAHLQDTLQMLFGLLSNLMLPADPNGGHHAIVKFIDSHAGTPVVTTNYDCCIDRALLNGNVPFSYTIEFANPQVLVHADEAGAPLIKLHGSLNWFYCETCQDVRLIEIESTIQAYRDRSGEYPIISVCNVCGGQKRGLLVPPHAMKFDSAPPLHPLIGNATRAFAGKSLIVVVGFSFSEADLYISRMVSKAMQESNDTRMLIIDPDSGVIEKVRRRFETQIPGFRGRDRILKISGDCATMLPQFLDGELCEKDE